MFVIETKQSSAAWKTSILMIVALLLTGGLAWIAAILTLHTYVRPKPGADEGFRLFGFRLGRR